MTLPYDYTERVYAGILGKIIGVYLGRPFENWLYEKIMAELGEVNYYVHNKFNVPLVVPDDDIAGTFTFLRALPDHGNQRNITSAQIGQTWLNYLIEKRTILWWGGMGHSTEHTAYLRLKHGIPAPQSGSIAMNGKVVAEQIGAQIFIDGWAMVAPGDPELAAELAKKASSVSHDGEAVYAAQVLAAMEAQAFVERDLGSLIDTGLQFIPKDSNIYRLINDLREWRAIEPDWRKSRKKINEKYGYSNYAGNCHIVPNHALIQLALLYGDDDFQKTLMIVNTCGWDTDCNSGNVGCFMGIKNGLAGIDHGPDWRGPVADRLYLPSSDGGRAITDAVQETYVLVNIGRALAYQEPLNPKRGARFHFELPGSVQGFQWDEMLSSNATITVTNIAGHSIIGSRSLALQFHSKEPDWFCAVSTQTFIPFSDLKQRTYELIASPTLYPGQTIKAEIEADPTNSSTIEGCLFIKYYGAKDTLQAFEGPMVSFNPGERCHFSWTIPDLNGLPIQAVGIKIHGNGEESGTLYLDYLTWSGTPHLRLTRPNVENSLWQRTWVDAVDYWEGSVSESFRLIQNEGIGMIIQGTREWNNYQVKASISSFMADSMGVAVSVQGLRRYYALLLCNDGKIRLVKTLGDNSVLKEVDFPLQFNVKYNLVLKVNGTHLQGWVDGNQLFDLVDNDQPLNGGAAALVVKEGILTCDEVEIS
ncbi:MAG: ADP-ribosylglycohydrolase family protein [Anaerolineales bacterium]|nr:ADP-ribosylglycohydrolase family protein [Anaerolineales bacterium]